MDTMSSNFDYNKVKSEVEEYLNDFVDDFDVDAIVEELDKCNVNSIDSPSYDYDDFYDLLRRYDMSDDYDA